MLVPRSNQCGAFLSDAPFVPVNIVSGDTFVIYSILVKVVSSSHSRPLPLFPLQKNPWMELFLLWTPAKSIWIVIFLEASYGYALVNYYSTLALFVHTSNPRNPTLGLGRTSFSRFFVLSWDFCSDLVQLKLFDDLYLEILSRLLVKLTLPLLR